MPALLACLQRPRVGTNGLFFWFFDTESPLRNCGQPLSRPLQQIHPGEQLAEALPPPPGRLGANGRTWDKGRRPEQSPTARGPPPSGTASAPSQHLVLGARLPPAGISPKSWRAFWAQKELKTLIKHGATLSCHVQLFTQMIFFFYV